MRIALIRYNDDIEPNTRLPKSLDRVRGEVAPLGILYIASMLKKTGHEVRIFDNKVQGLSKKIFENEIGKFRPDFCGITVMSSTIHGALEAARICKTKGAIVIIGGPQLAAFPKESISYDFVDFGIIGEAENSLVDFIECYGHSERYKQIEGLVFKENNRIVVNKPAIVQNLNDLPFPGYHLVPMHRYRSVISGEKTATMITSRGCPYKCGFCFKTPSDKKIRFRNPENVVDEIEYLIKDFGIKELMFYDDILTLRREHITGICEEILRRKIKIRWESLNRVDLVDRDLLLLMKRAGCFRIRYGVESGNEEILKLMKKYISLNKTREIFILTNNLGIETFAYFIIGYVNETEETIKDTIKFSIKLNPSKVMFTIATPYPKTDLFNLAVRKHLISPNYWEDYSLGKRHTRIPYLLKEADKWCKRAYYKFYFRPKCILTQVKKCIVNNELKNTCQAFKGLLGMVLK